jgi:carboxyl-terminal processing protease
MAKNNRFGWSVLVTASLLIGFVGFGLGFNYPQIQKALFENESASTPQEEGLPDNLDYSELEALYDQLRDNFAGELDAEQLLEGAKEGLVAATGDPHTAYLDDEAAQQFQEGLDGTFSGIGAEISVKEEQLVIVAPIDGSPAQKSGLQPSDKILAINDETTVGMSIDTAVSKIRGEAGSKVTLLIVRGNKSPQEVVITRDVITVPSVNSEIKNGQIGYIEISRFGPDTYQDFKKAAMDLQQKGARKIVLDMRNNPGGLLDVAVDIADEFLDSGAVIVEERKDGVVLETLKSRNGGLLHGLPTVVLINEGSASASEIIAGALQENNAARVVGKQSFGKGSVQELIELEGQSLLKVTIALWYTPKGRNITEEGIEPDVKVELTEADIDKERDPQLQKALELLR